MNIFTLFCLESSGLPRERVDGGTFTPMYSPLVQKEWYGEEGNYELHAVLIIIMMTIMMIDDDDADNISLIMSPGPVMIIILNNNDTC